MFRMTTIINIDKLFFELICVSIGTQKSLSRIPKEREWANLYKMAEKQSLLGVCFAGLKNLGADADDGFTRIGMSKMQYLNWMGMAFQIQQRNEKVDRQCVELQATLSADGLVSAILKGQGVARLYDGQLRPLRQSGDIDVWVKGGFEAVNDFVQRTAPSRDLAYHRFHYSIFKDTEVELHFRPTLMRNLLDNMKLQRWCDSFDASSFVKASGLDITVPPAEFNAVFILTHIYRHFLFEGVGLRQVMDYYYVLKSVPAELRVKVMDILDGFHMGKFAAAMMWVIGHVFGMGEEYMICQPEEKEGSFLLEEIMQMGNFGKEDKRYKGNKKMKRFARHWFHLLVHYPSEVVWSPIWIVYHWFWKRSKLRLIDSKQG